MGKSLVTQNERGRLAPVHDIRA